MEQFLLKNSLFQKELKFGTYSKSTTVEIAKELDINEYTVLQNIDESYAKAVDSSKFDEIISDISKSGKILMIKITPSFESK